MAKKEIKGTLKDLDKATGPGIDITVAVLVGVLFGHWLDLRFETGPWLMITGFVLGVAAGFLNVYRMIKEADG